MSDPDQELEIDVQNDDVPTTAHTNGTSNSRKDGRESAQSVSSRDSATPKSSAARSNSLIPSNSDMALLMQQFAANGRPLDPRALMFNNSPTTDAACYSFISKGGKNQPFAFPPDAITAPGVPNNISKLFELNPEEVVCAVTIAPTNDRVYTGGKGFVKLWDIGSTDTEKPPASRLLSTFSWQKEQYVRSCKLFPEQSWLLVGGEAPSIVVFDVNVRL